MDIMHRATPHGVGLINKLHFVIFAAFKESMTLNLAQRSFKVIDFGTNRKLVYIFLLVVTWTVGLSSTVSEIRRLICRKSTIFLTLTPIQAKIWWSFIWSRSMILGLQRERERGKVRLISRKIIFHEFWPIWSPYLNIGQTDRHLALAIPRSP